MHPRELLSGRVGALAGVVFVVLLFTSTVMLDVPRSVSDAELVEWWSDDANLNTVLVSTYLQIAAGMFFLVFLACLRSVSLPAEGGSGTLTSVAFSAGVVFVALLLASDGPRGVIAFAVRLRDEPLPAVDLLRYMPQLGYVLLGTVGGVVVGISAVANSVLVLRTGAFGRWLGIVGLVCGLGSIALALVVGPFFIPALLFWVLASSLALWRQPAAETATAMRAHDSAAAVAG
jgi:hypothetical protein